MTDQQFIEYIRTYIADYPSFNEVVDKTEFSDGQILRARDLAMSTINHMYYETNFPWTSIPIHILAPLTVAYLLQMGGYFHIRQLLPFSDGGVSVDLHGKGAQYLQAFVQELQAAMNHILSFKANKWVDSLWSKV